MCCLLKCRHKWAHRALHTSFQRERGFAHSEGKFRGFVIWITEHAQGMHQFGVRASRWFLKTLSLSCASSVLCVVVGISKPADMTPQHVLAFEKVRPHPPAPRGTGSRRHREDSGMCPPPSPSPSNIAGFVHEWIPLSKPSALRGTDLNSPAHALEVRVFGLEMFAPTVWEWMHT
jgi:hypothetical protein